MSKSKVQLVKEVLEGGIRCPKCNTIGKRQEPMTGVSHKALWQKHYFCPNSTCSLYYFTLQGESII